MPIKVKTNLASAKETTVKVSAVDSEKLIAALDKLNKTGHWGKYTVVPSVALKFGKDKKLAEVTIKAKPVSVLPVWVEYSQTTKARQAEWDKMVPNLKEYLANHHALFLKAVATFATELKTLDLDKAGFDKLWKTQKVVIAKVTEDYGIKTSGGFSLGVSLAVIGPDPVEGVSDIKSPKTAKYNIGGKTIKAVFDALEKRISWGRYNIKYFCSMKFALDGKLSKITVKAAPRIDMPKWTYYGKANKAQKATWDNMWGHLEFHENKHHTIFTGAFKAFLKDIKNMDLDRTEAADHWEQKKAEWEDLQEKFDDETNHGGNKGVKFDFSADP